MSYVKNRVELMGFWGQEPGKQIHKEDEADARYPLAGHQDWCTGKDEQRKEKTEWHRMRGVIFRRSPPR